MCGRFILTSPGKDMQDQFGLLKEPELTPRYNIAPTQMVPVVRIDQETIFKQFEMLKWGLPQFLSDFALMVSGYPYGIVQQN